MQLATKAPAPAIANAAKTLFKEIEVNPSED